MKNKLKRFYKKSWKIKINYKIWLLTRSLDLEMCKNLQFHLNKKVILLRDWEILKMEKLLI